MPTAVRSYGKINIGLVIGPGRPDGYHELRTIYQTIGLHDIVKVEAKAAGTGIEIRSKHPRVPADETNTCYRVAERVLKLLKRRGKVTISIEKRLPVQGGMGGGSSNAVATLFALERELRAQIEPADRLRIAAEVGSDLPLFCLGGAALGAGHGEEVFPLPDLPPLPAVVVTPALHISTPEAFRAWDRDHAQAGDEDRGWRAKRQDDGPKLTAEQSSDRISMFSRSAYEWLSGHLFHAGVPRGKATKGCGDRAEALLLDLVRAGIENDFERVVFPQYPELREVKRALQKNGAQYASLSGSGSTVYGLCCEVPQAESLAEALRKEGMQAEVTATLPRTEYWGGIFV
ncbi:MAG: 4-(cytidine 5'-diphospho)-2-C-methyl-D-erythritol kinase [Acidobacteria bacterium]|nr:4-(cytidine 5'-diphospho)-2-C-methyl-D-erythritol kinase [Acidobacteriota bacterium]